MPLYNAETAFGKTDDSPEVYLGTWFGYDAWSYPSHSETIILLVEGDEPGDYRTWVGSDHWFDENARIGSMDGSSMPISEYLTTTDHGKAFLMAFAALHHLKS